MIDKIWKLTEKGVTDYNGKVGSVEEVVEVLNTYHFKVNDYLRENNKLREENEKLKQENKRLKEILKIKRKEIINRVLALQEITDKYTNEILFKNNVNPNDAVKQVLKEILSSKVIDDD